MKNENLSVNFSTNVKIIDVEQNEILLDDSNAIHAQNMGRVISRGLSNEINSIIHRIAFGNGGSFVDVGDNIVLNPPNDGTGGEGWQSRLYNETYSEIVDNENPEVGIDPGSWGPNSKRIGGGSVPTDDPESNSVVSHEAGRKSVITATCFLNKNEPVSQLGEKTFDQLISEEEQTFQFDELGFYSPGKPAESVPGYLRVDVGNKTSDDLIPSDMYGNTYTISLEVDGSAINDNLTIPDPNASGGQTGSGPSGELTYGDLCEGINTGNWLDQGNTSPFVIDLNSVYITDRSTTNTYPSILGEESFGFLVFESATVGDSSTVILPAGSCTSGEFFFDISNETCSIESTPGDDSGTQNSSVDPDNERERLLTHITFPPILKKENRTLKIVYSLTVSVAQVGETVVDVNS